MILTIMNCESCGADLREWDFLRKRARLIENRPYCVACRPVPGSAWKPPVGRLRGALPNGARTLPTNQNLPL